MQDTRYTICVFSCIEIHAKDLPRYFGMKHFHHFKRLVQVTAAIYNKTPCAPCLCGELT